MAKREHADEIKLLVDKVADLDERRQNIYRHAEELHNAYLELGAAAAEARARLYKLGVRID